MINKANEIPAVGARELLTKGGLGKKKYFLYEGAMDTSIYGSLCEEPFFKGLKEGADMPLLLCRGTTLGALIATDKAGNKAVRSLSEQKKFTDLYIFDFSRLSDPMKLDEIYPKHILRKYFEDLGIDSSGKGYQDLIDSGLEDIKDSLPEMFNGISSKYSFTTVPVMMAFWQLGIAADVHELLRSRHLLYPKAISPTPFGKQCGLVVRLCLMEDGSVRRELRVVKSALRAFWEALSFKRTLHFESGTRLCDRLERLDNWRISSQEAQRAILPKLLTKLQETLDADMDTVAETMHEAGKGEIMNELARAGGFGKAMRFGQAMKALSERVDTQDVHCYVPSEQGVAWEALCDVGEIVRTNGITAPCAHQEPREKALSERLEGLKYTLLPFQDMQISHYLLAVATACDSSFPLWICQRLGLGEILRECSAGPFTPLSMVMRLVHIRDNDMLLYALIVRPLAEVFDAQNPKNDHE